MLLSSLLLFVTTARAAIDVPFEQLDTGNVVVPVTVDGVVGRFVVDTGASVTLVRPALWSAAGHDPEKGPKVGGAGAGGAVSGARVVSLPTVTLGGETVRVGFAVVLDTAAAAKPGAPALFDGILGQDVLRHYVVALDFSAHVMHLYGPEETAPEARSWSRTRRLRGGLTRVDAVLGGTTLPAVVDLGAASTILNPAAAALPILSKVADCGGNIVGVDDHAFAMTCAHAATLTVGSHDFGARDLHVSDLPVFGVLRLDRPALILGVDLLGTGTLILDSRHHRIGWE